MRRRFYHPPRVRLGTLLSRMPVGKSGYLAVNDVVVGWDGGAWANALADVSPSDFSSV